MKQKLRSLLCGAAALAALVTTAALADIAQSPLSMSHAVRPRIMFVMSNDHALYYKAYTDWNDLDGDAISDTTYTPGFNYYGYFDSAKCYSYANARFEPAGITTDGYCDTVAGDWSGNFLNWATMARMDVVRKVLYGGHRSTDSPTETVLERTHLPSDAHSFAKFYDGTDIAQLTPFNVTSLTLCNTTYVSTGQSESITTLPRISVAKGDYRYWAANERWQCTWDNEEGDNSSGSNSTSSNTSDPKESIEGLRVSGMSTANYNARVKVCVSGLLGGENCKRYPNGNYKPIGLLHEYGETDQLFFGLMTGSYAKNKSGGVLRKNIDSFADEVNIETDGTFTGVDGIVKNLGRFRIARYDYGDGTYNTTDSCTWGLSSFTEGKCSNWGNPFSEIYLESLRYYANLTATTDFAATDSNYITGLTSPAWKDPFKDPLDATSVASDNWCARCEVILINASETSYDHDQLSAGGLRGSPVASEKTDILGDAEGISGRDFFVGESGDSTNQLCTAKQVGALGDVRGACPGSPRLSGTYFAAGLAHWARTNDIRDLKDDQFVTTRSVALLSAAPNLVIPVPGSDATVSILPACRNLTPNPDGNCAIVDFKIVEQDIDAGTGAVYVNWEDSEQGGDYDQDMKGMLSYAIVGSQITVTTQVNRKSTDHVLGFGYVIGGTTQDGFHAHTGINRFAYNDTVIGRNYTSTDPTSCSDCNVTEAASSFTYTLGSSTAGLLEQPLWYAAKYGSFNDINNNRIPDRRSEWDADNDGQPDNFFLASDPGELGPSLARFLDIIAATSSSSAVATNSVTLNSESLIFQGRYDSEDWSGDLVAFRLGMDGTIGAAVWHARDQINAQSESGNRRIVTMNETTRLGTPFRWGASGLAASQMASLCPTCTEGADEAGEDLVNYLRGGDADEVDSGGTLRTREFKLGDIADSDPVYVGAPDSVYPDDLEAHPYQAFVSANADRDAVVYVGANDGMLHGFDVATGAEVFAYVPRAVYRNLARLATLNYHESHHYYVNGGPTAGDVYLGADDQWRTLLVGGLGAGGAGIYAIDVTDPTALAASESSAAQRVRWDITAADEGFADLGLTFSRPALIRLPDLDHSGAWAAVFGNGYHDAADDVHGKAVLYFVSADTGDLLHSVVADNGPGNGLSSVAPVDYDGDARVDFIYAGDLKGNLWRFEPDGVGGWELSFSGLPLFKAGTAAIESESTQVIEEEVCVWNPQARCLRYKKDVCTKWEGKQECHMEEREKTIVTSIPETIQPITVRPEVIRHPYGGVMVLFGTGTFFKDSDRLPHPDITQSVYGVWDRRGGVGGIRKHHLLRQSVTTETRIEDYEVRLTSANPIAWHRDAGHPTTNPAETHLGWYLDLVEPDGTGAGELQVTEPIARGGRIIFTTMLPSTLQCDFGGDSWLVELNALDGRPMDEVVFDLNGDGVFNVLDMAVTVVNGQTIHVAPSAKKSKVGITQEPAIVGAGAKEFKYLSGAREAAIEEVTENPGDLAGGRRSWLQLH